MQISFCIYAIYGCSSKKYHIHWTVDRIYFCEMKKLYTLENLFPEINTITYEEKMFFETTTLLWFSLSSWVVFSPEFLYIWQ